MGFSIDNTELNEQIVDALCRGGTEVCVRCGDKYQRARVLQALQDFGVDINIGLDRRYHLLPDDPSCDFEFPHVRVRRYDITCIWAKPEQNWFDPDDFIARLGTIKNTAESMEAPAIPDLI